ncbi:EamA family transporter [Arthrobacter koreensis]|uniref:EamA family transporter n=1 Tax=Arthrobacter koreensis TaxID=199136 RepID=UPI002DBEB6FE|nr:EamA family transporter [Arthrobacter koreensis]MEB7503993.1 EamA family transporter [Arthrobacter koreensis]
MLSKFALLSLSALAPVAWGTTYLVTTEFLPPDRPLLAAVLRSLPAGLVLLAALRKLPEGAWWWKAAVLGLLNFGAFFALLFVAAYRLPGGVAAMVGAVQPLLVAVLASTVLGERLGPVKIGAGAAGIAGVGLLVLSADARLDTAGVLAALGGAASMAAGIVLTKRWQPPAGPLVSTAWQLVAGGVFLIPVTLVVEGPALPSFTAWNLAGYLYLALVGTVLAYWLWFRGIRQLPASSVSFLSLLSPVVATAAGAAVLGESFAPGQLVGLGLILGALAAANVAGLRPGTGQPQRRRPGYWVCQLASDGPLMAKVSSTSTRWPGSAAAGTSMQTSYWAAPPFSSVGTDVPSRSRVAVHVDSSYWRLSEPTNAGVRSSQGSPSSLPL